MTRPHILIIVENLPVPPDYRVWRIATTLHGAGYRVSVICPATRQWPAGDFEIDGVRVYRHWMPREARRLPGYLWEYSVALLQEFRFSIRIWRRGKFNAIHACNPPDLIWIVALFWRLFGVKFVYDHHDLCPELVLAKAGVQSPRELGLMGRLVYRVMLLMERVSHRLARVVLATNESYRAVATGRNGCSEHRVYTVRTAPLEAELPVAAVGAVLPFRIGYVGVMARQDGVDGLLRIAHCLRTELRKAVELVLIGDGPEREQLEQLAQQLGISDAVRFRGFLPRADMVRELGSCAIGVTPDPAGPMNNASTMLKVLDYLACGVPQVMYDLPENRSSAGNAAVYVAPGDEAGFAVAIARLLDDVAQRTELARRGRERMRGMVWERNGAIELLKAYHAAVPETFNSVAR